MAVYKTVTEFAAVTAEALIVTSLVVAASKSIVKLVVPFDVNTASFSVTDVALVVAPNTRFSTLLIPANSAARMV